MTKTITSIILFAALAASGDSLAQVSSPAVLEEIIVTAQKREQSIVDVPIAMTALSDEQIQKTHAKTIADIQALVPNFSFESVNGFDNISIRGVGGGGRSIGFDPRSGLYIDGVYIGQASALAQPLFGIERVEILRGPQGHLFGRNTVSGAVSLTTQGPSEEGGGNFGASVGNEDAYEIYGSVNGALSESARGKISAAYEERAGFGTNVFSNSEIDDLQRASLRAQLSIAASERLTFDIFGDYSKTERLRPVGEAQTGGAAAGSTTFPTPPRTVDTNSAPQDDNEIGGASITANYDMDNGLLFTSISAYRFSQQDRVNDTDYSPLDLINIVFDDEYNQISQEFRLTSPGDQRTRYVVGLYFLNEDAKTLRDAHVGMSFVPTPFDITIDSEVDTTTIAAFASVDIDLTDNATLNLGARYTNEEKDLLYSFTNGPALGLGTVSGLTDTVSEDRFTPTVSLTLAINDRVNIYGKYSTGFKSGGFNAEFVTQQSISDGLSFDTETVDSFEVGIKGASASGRVNFDAAVFTANYDDFQILQFVEVGMNLTDIQLRNAAEVATRGVEASLRFAASDSLQLGLNLAYLNAEFDSFPNAAGVGVDYNNNELPNAPDFTGTLTIDYRIPLSSGVGDIDIYGEYSHRAESFSLANNDPVFAIIPARNIVNGRMSYTPRSGDWSIGLWARNLFDEEYIDLRARDFLGNEFIRRADPRTWGADVRYNF